MAKNALNLRTGKSFPGVECIVAEVWTLRQPSAQWSPRTGHQVVSFKHKLYLLGGADASTEPLNDIWYSTDDGGECLTD